jgi:antitoxin YefM
MAYEQNVTAIGRETGFAEKGQKSAATDNTVSKTYLYLYRNSNINPYAMKAANFTEFRTNLKQFLDDVEDHNEILIIKRGAGKGAVLISLAEYNSLMETFHLLGSKANADHLYESMNQVRAGKAMEKKLIRVK